jgi:hypothetical protein
MEINGHRYDATTGQVIGAVSKSAHQIKTSATGVMDGFIRPKQVVKAQHRQVARTVKHTAQSVHKTTQRSKTLMRAAVTKPARADITPVKAAKQPAHRTEVASGPAHSPKFVQANSTPKHAHVQRFGVIGAAKPATAPNKVVATVRPHQPKAEAHTPAPLPSMTASASHQHLERLLDHALANADSHKQALHHRRRTHRLFSRVKRMPKLLTIGGSLIILGAVGSLTAWQKVPQVAVRVAAARASVDAGLPSYAPSGFSFNAPVHYSQGSVSMQYASNGQKYVLTQQNSNWDSSSLASNVFSKNSQVQTSQVNGTTVYVYGNSNDATWVNHGIRYTLSDSASLTTDQILKIANSL